MKLKDTQPRPRRRALSISRQGLWASAILALLTLGSGTALADDRRGHHRHGSSCDHRVDRDRYDHHRYDRHRYDRHRRDHRYERHRYDRYRHRHYEPYRYRSNPYRSRAFTIPRVIAHGARHHYQSYHHGRVYHAAHRHYHQVYRFPVYVDYRVVYYPYAYCEGSYFGRGVFRDGRPVFDIHISF